MHTADSLSHACAVVCPSPHLGHCCSVPVPAVGQSGKRDQRCGVRSWMVEVAEDNNWESCIFYIFYKRGIFWCDTPNAACGVCKRLEIVLTYMLGKRFVVLRHKSSLSNMWASPQNSRGRKLEELRARFLAFIHLVYKIKNNSKLVFSMLYWL